MALKPQNVEDLVPYQSKFSDSKFWKKLSNVAYKLGRGTTYYVLVMYYVMLSPDVSLKDKSIICGALGYLILPTDLIPDFILMLGFTDDIAAIMLAYNAIKNSVTPEIEAKANAKLAVWFPEK